MPFAQFAIITTTPNELCADRRASRSATVRWIVPSIRIVLVDLSEPSRLVIPKKYGCLAGSVGVAEVFVVELSLRHREMMRLVH